MCIHSVCNNIKLSSNIRYLYCDVTLLRYRNRIITVSEVLLYTVYHIPGIRMLLYAVQANLIQRNIHSSTRSKIAKLPHLIQWQPYI